MRVAGDPERRPWSGEAGARWLFATVRRACAGGEDLPARLAAGLGAALETLARDPELARLLTVEPYLDRDAGALDAQRRWIGRFADLLGDAAVADPRADAGFPFVAPVLIGGVSFQIARLVVNGEASDLPRLLPGMLEALLAYYFEPGEPPRLARGALTAGGLRPAAGRAAPAGSSAGVVLPLIKAGEAERSSRP